MAASSLYLRLLFFVLSPLLLFSCRGASPPSSSANEEQQVINVGSFDLIVRRKGLASYYIIRVVDARVPATTELAMRAVEVSTYECTATLGTVEQIRVARVSGMSARELFADLRIRVGENSRTEGEFTLLCAAYDGPRPHQGGELDAGWPWLSQSLVAAIPSQETFIAAIRGSPRWQKLIDASVPGERAFWIRLLRGFHDETRVAPKQ